MTFTDICEKVTYLNFSLKWDHLPSLTFFDGFDWWTWTTDKVTWFLSPDPLSVILKRLRTMWLQKAAHDFQPLLQLREEGLHICLDHRSWQRWSQYYGFAFYNQDHALQAESPGKSDPDVKWGLCLIPQWCTLTDCTNSSVLRNSVVSCSVQLLF